MQKHYQSICKKENMQDFTLTSFTIRAHLSVNLEAWKRFESCCFFFFLAHTDPCVSDNHICIGTCLSGICCEVHGCVLLKRRIGTTSSKITVYFYGHYNHRETIDSYLLGKALRNFCDFIVWLIALIYKRKIVSMNTYGKQGVLNISWLGGAINWSSFVLDMKPGCNLTFKKLLMPNIGSSLRGEGKASSDPTSTKLSNLTSQSPQK